MLGRGARQNGHAGEASTPLLSSSHEDVPSTLNQDVLFTLDDEDNGESSALAPPPSSGKEHTVRFQEDVQVIAPPLRSTYDSREAEYELDPDDLDDDSIAQMDPEQGRRPRSGRRDEQAMPLLVGLLDASAVRRSSDIAMGVNGEGPHVEVDLDELAAKQNAGGGMLNSVANMANSILGAGIIGLPYAVSRAGFFTGLSLLIVLCGVTDWTIRLIVMNAKLSGTNSYIGMMNHCFGPSGRAAVSLFQFAFAFGGESPSYLDASIVSDQGAGMCAFGIIIGDTIPHVIRFIFPTLSTIPVLSLLTNRQFVIALCTISVSYPLSLYRDIHKLSIASGLALCGMLIIVGSVIFEGPLVSPLLKGDPAKRFSIIEPGVFQAIGVISFAFVCHHNSLLIYGSLRTPTMDRFAKVTHISTAISLVACTTMAVSGYLVFTDRTQGNILNNFSETDTLINVARFCFGLNMFTTLPLELFVCREVIEQYFFSHEPFSMQRHVFFTTAILFASMLLALITCDLGVMLEITGGVSATALAFIFPAACYIKLTGKDKSWRSRALLPAYVCAAFGAVVMVLSMFLALGKVWSHEGDAKICM
ncbi:amino acid transporter [Auriscalpium vulgare]|uniref:Amino acid transporter n=1 Tax=Auriscalpium vulgare TaxID=40419 RepID=A0ACB8S0C4_9AGAM|nr:amino acid transporter [Auriscalpium vulgare]